MRFPNYTKISSLLNEFDKISIYLGPDFAIRLGSNIFCPDVAMIKHDNKSTLYEYYLDGPPNLIIELVTPESQHVYTSNIE